MNLFKYLNWHIRRNRILGPKWWMGQPLHQAYECKRASLDKFVGGRHLGDNWLKKGKTVPEFEPSECKRRTRISKETDEWKQEMDGKSKTEQLERLREYPDIVRMDDTWEASGNGWCVREKNGWVVDLESENDDENHTDTASDVSTATSSATPTAKSNEDLIFYTVYGMRYVPVNCYVYVGHTHNKPQRFEAHTNLTSGCRRVAIALAQPNVQPIAEHFVLEELWTGACSPTEARAIEQFYMDKHDTRIPCRPREGITKDIDLINGAEPRQLNVNRACKDAALLAWAAERVSRDTQLVVRRTPEEEQAMQTMLLALFEPNDAPVPDDEDEEEEVLVSALALSPTPSPAEPVTMDNTLRDLKVELFRAAIEREKATTRAQEAEKRYKDELTLSVQQGRKL